MGHRKRTQYTDVERAEFCVALEAEGYSIDQTKSRKGSLTKVSVRSGVARSTLGGWFRKRNNAPPPQLRQEKRVELAHLFEELAYLYLEQAATEKAIANTRGKDAIIAAATAVDKMRLLNEQSTENIATKIVLTWPSLPSIHSGGDPDGDGGDDGD